MKYLLAILILSVLVSCEKKQCYTCTTDVSDPYTGHKVSEHTYCDESKKPDDYKDTSTSAGYPITTTRTCR